MPCCVWELLCLFLCAAATSGHEHGPDVTTVVVSEWDDVILPCSLSSKENLEQNQFIWIKNETQEVFRFNGSGFYNSSRPDQDEEFEERVSHFPEQLQVGVASIKIKYVELRDAGNYTCIIPRLLKEDDRFNVRLVVEPILRDRSLEIPDALVKPFARILDTSVDGVLLRCEAHGATIKPTLTWRDSDANILPTRELSVDERGGRYSVFLLVAVNRTYDNFFQCDATQEEIHHRVYDAVSVPDQLFESCPSEFMWIAVWLSGVLSLAAVLALIACGKCIIRRIKKDSRLPHTDWSFEPELKR